MLSTNMEGIVMDK